MTTATAAPLSNRATSPVLTLADLCRSTPQELDVLYAGATTPLLAELDADYDGVLLTGQFPPRDGRFPITFVNQPWLPWRGKTFSPGRSRGANRFRVGGRRFELWPFEPRIVPSMFGGEAAVLIDYDIPGNTFLMRKGVFDELKKLRDGLFLGKGGIRLGGRHLFIFYWALAPA